MADDILGPTSQNVIDDIITASNDIIDDILEEGGSAGEPQFHRGGGNRYFSDFKQFPTGKALFLGF